MISTNFKKIDQNFWDAHPDMRITTPFKQLWETDESKKKIYSSNIMWFIALCYDKESKYRKMPAEGEDGKHLLIGEDYLEEKWFYEERKEVLNRLIDSYITIFYTALERQLLELEETLDIRREVIKELRKSKVAKDWKQVDDMILGTNKLVAEVKSLKQKIAEEDNNGLTKGGASRSLND